jgi:hypothetical protein
MRIYNQQRRFYCDVDLHARSMFAHVLNLKGKTVFEKYLLIDPDEYPFAIKPFRKNIVVGRLADLFQVGAGQHCRRPGPASIRYVTLLLASGAGKVD